MNEQAIDKSVSVKSLLAAPAYQKRFSELLKENSPQFCSSLVQISQSWSLSKCDPHSVIAAAMTAAALDLPINPNLGFAWVIPYKDKASFQLGYKGLVQLANRSGQYHRINVTEVYEGELESHNRLTSDLVLDPAKKKSEKVIGYAAYFRLSNGHEHAEYWSVETVKNHAARFSQAYRAKKQDSPWFTDFDAMAKKTVLKSLLSHWGPLSVAMQKAVIEDNSVRAMPESEMEFPDRPQSEDGRPIDVAGEQTTTMEQEPATEKATRQTRSQQREAGSTGGTTPQAELKLFVESSGFTFAQLIQFGGDSGNIPDATSLPDWDAIPSEVCKRLMRSKKGLTDYLQKIKDGEQQ